MLNDEDTDLFEQLSIVYPTAVREAIKVQQFINQKYGKKISVSEIAYLSIHIHRLMQEQ